MYRKLYNCIMFVLCLSSLIPAISGGYVKQEYDFIFESYEDYSNLNSTEIDLLQITNHNHSVDLGKTIMSRVRPSLINLTNDTYSFISPFIFTKSEIMNGAQNVTLMLPFKNHTWNLSLKIYLCPIFTLNISKSNLWYEVQNPEMLNDTNRSYVRLPMACILPGRYYLLELNLTSELLVWINNQPYSEKSPITFVVNDQEINLTLDIGWKFTKFLSPYGGAYRVNQLPSIAFPFESYTLNISTAFNLSDPFDVGFLYFYADLINPFNLSINVGCVWYDIEKNSIGGVSEEFHDYYIEAVNESDGDNNKSVDFTYTIFKTTVENGYYYIPLFIDDQLNSFKIKHKYDSPAIYTTISEHKTMMRPSATLLYDAATYPIDDFPGDPEQLVTQFDIVAVLGDIWSVLEAHFIDPAGRLIKFIGRTTKELITRVVKFAVALPVDFLKLFGGGIIDLFRSGFGLLGGFVDIVKQQLQFTFDFIVSILETTSYWLIEVAIPASLIFFIVVPMILGGFKISQFLPALARDDIKKAEKWSSIKPWEVKK